MLIEAATLFVIQMTTLTAPVIAIPLSLAKNLPTPDVAMIVLLVLASFDAVSGLPGAYRRFGEALAAARRVFEIIDTKPAVTEPAREAAHPRRFDIAFRHVSMRYGESMPWALEDVALEVPAGGSLGIMGPTGSGKTSVANILLRFWDFQKGEALVGACRSAICQATRCAGCAWSSPSRPNSSIPASGRISASPGQRPARQKWTPHCAMPAWLSGRQARRIAIARAFLKNAPILILDEPTEGLDARSAHIVAEAIERLMRGRTTLLITHRRRPLRNLNHILTLGGPDLGLTPPVDRNQID
jgi:ATP-binding cassette subfamily C protein CydC